MMKQQGMEHQKFRQQAGQTDCDWADEYNVVWNSHGHSSSDSMPLGDGDTGINLWTTRKDGIFMLLGRSDTIAHQKCGRLHLSFEPNVFEQETSFEQVLHLKDGYAGIQTDSTEIKIWVDADIAENETVSFLHIEGKSRIPLAVTASYELWREYDNVDYPRLDVESEKKDFICDRNQEIVWFQKSLRKGCRHTLYVGGKLAGTGSCGNFERSGLHALKGRQLQSFHVTAALSADDAEGASRWYEELCAREQAYEKTSRETHFLLHRQWWNEFWSRSHIKLSNFGTADCISARYTLQRYVFACSSRGLLPSLYNGSIFRYDTPKDAISAFNWVAEEDFSADMRPWNDAYMGQNTRHQFWPLLASGDFDLIEPLIRLIRGKLKEARMETWETMGHKGAFLTEFFFEGGYRWDKDDLTELPECRRGIRSEDSAEKKVWHLQYHFLATIEFVTLFAELYLHTLDSRFLEEVLLPCADEFILFYSQHYPVKDEFGKRIFYPAGTAETYGKARSSYYNFPQQEDVANPVSEISGLRRLLSLLLSLGKSRIGSGREDRWRKFLGELPGVPVKKSCGQTLLAPGERYSPGLTCESNELYAVWPFRQISFLSDPIKLACGRQSLYTRRLSLDGSTDYQYWETGGWHPASIDAAVLGLPKEAARLLELNYVDALPNIAFILDVPFQERPGIPRFPGFWNHPHMDGTPDQCHGGVCMNALQQMLLQWDGDKIYLFPAWPDCWDADFKLHAPLQTTVECVYRAGRIVSLKVTPESRRKDVVDCSAPEFRIKTAAATACADRNRFFGLPPMEDGVVQKDDFAYRPTIQPWLEQYSQSIVQVSGGPFEVQKWGGSVYRDNIIYLHVFSPTDQIVLPDAGLHLMGAEALTGGSVGFRAEKDEWILDLRECPFNGHTILKLTADASADAAAQRMKYAGSVAEKCPASASSVLSPSCCADCAVDGNSSTFWSPAPGDAEQWLQVDLGRVQPVGRVEIHRKTEDPRYGSRCPLRLLYEDGEGIWQTICDSQMFGEFWSQKFGTVWARKIKLLIDSDGIRFLGVYRDS